MNDLKESLLRFQKTRHRHHYSVDTINETIDWLITADHSKAIFWHPETLEAVSVRDYSKKRMTASCVSPDKRYWLAAFYRDDVHIVDGKTKKLIKKLKTRKAYTIKQMLFNPAGDKLFIMDSSLGIFRFPELEEAVLATKIRGISEIFYLDNDLLLTKSIHHISMPYYKDEEDILRLWDLGTGEQKWNKRYGFTFAQLSPDKSLFITGYDRFFLFEKDTGKEIANHIMPIIWHTGWFRYQSLIQEIVFIDEDTLLFRTAYNVGRFSLSDFENYQILHTANERLLSIHLLSKNLYMYVQTDGIVRVQSLRHNDVLAELKLEDESDNTSELVSSAYYPDKDLLVLGAEKGQVHFISIPSQILASYDEYIASAKAFNPARGTSFDGDLSFTRKLSQPDEKND